MITENTIYDQVTILEDGQIQLRQARIILEDGVEIARIFRREVKEPGDDVSKYTKLIQDVSNIIWTKQVIDDFKKKKADNIAATLLTGAKK